MTVQLTQPLHVASGRYVDFGGSVYLCPPGAPGVILRGTGEIRNVTFRRENAPTHPGVLLEDATGYSTANVTSIGSQYGFQHRRTSDVTHHNPRASLSDLDGLKLIDHCYDTTLRGGAFCKNGTSTTAKGDGIDAYDGAMGLLVDGTICDENSGNGITGKTAPNHPTDGSGNPQHGTPSDYTFRDVKARKNKAAGLSIEGAQETGVAGNIEPRPIVARVHITGGDFSGNLWDGIYCGARDWTARGFTCRNNGRAGFKVGSLALDWVLSHALLIDNGKVLLMSNSDAPVNSAGKRAPGLWIVGKRGKVSHCIIRGVESAATWDGTEYAGLTSTHRWSVWATKDADDVDIDRCNLGCELTGVSVRNDATGAIRVDGVVL